MKIVLSLSALAIALAVPAAAHAQAGDPPEGTQHQAKPQDHSQHQGGQGDADQRGASAESAAPHQISMKDCKCCCCEAMRKKMREHGQSAEAESHQGDG